MINKDIFIYKKIKSKKNVENERKSFKNGDRRCDRIKALLWDGDGFLLLYKRLDNGSFKWPRTETQARQLSQRELRWLLEGLELEQPKAIKPGNRGALY